MVTYLAPASLARAVALRGSCQQGLWGPDPSPSALMIVLGLSLPMYRVGEASPTSQTPPSSWAAWWYFSRDPENSSSLTSVVHLPFPQKLAACSASELLRVSLSAVALYCPNSAQRGWWAPGGRRDFYSWMCPPAFPHRRVLPTRHKLQRLKYEGKKHPRRGSCFQQEPGV